MRRSLIHGSRARLPTPAEPERVAPASASRSGPVPRVRCTRTALATAPFLLPPKRGRNPDRKYGGAFDRVADAMLELRRSNTELETKLVWLNTAESVAWSRELTWRSSSPSAARRDPYSVTCIFLPQAAAIAGLLQQRLLRVEAEVRTVQQAYRIRAELLLRCQRRRRRCAAAAGEQQGHGDDQQGLQHHFICSVNFVMHSKNARSVLSDSVLRPCSSVSSTRRF